LLVTPNQPTAGASGAIFGVLGGLLVLERRGHIGTGGQVLMMIILNLVFTFAVPGISIGGHIGGLIAGFVVMLSFTRFRHSWQASVGTAALIAAIAVAVAYATVT
jgi:membrane associated rhomboid family serine protease